jgi:S-adenosylhomocysteine hydrolase
MIGTRPAAQRDLSVFDLYAELEETAPAQWPKPLRDALGELQALANRFGGRFTYRQLKLLEGRLSGNMASVDLFDRLYEYAGQRFFQQHGRAFSPMETIPTMERYFDDPAVGLQIGELTPKWAARTYARLLAEYAKPADLAAMETAHDGGYAQREAFLAKFREFFAPFKKKVDALASELERKTPGTDEYWRVRGELKEALWESHFASQAMLAQGADLSLAAESAGADAKQVFDALTLRAKMATGADPTTSHRRVTDLHGDAEAIAVQAAIDQQHELGRLPVMHEIAEHLRAQGRLHDRLFADVEVVMKGHVTPSMLQMVELMQQFGGLKHLHAEGKGVSTVPLTGAMVDLLSKTFEPGYGDSLLTEAEHASRLRTQMGGWIRRAFDGARSLLVIGDGYEAARAANEAALGAPGTLVGYCATTQSDLNYLRGAEELGVVAGTLAGTALKDAVTSRLVAEWIAEHDGKWIEETKRKPLAEATVVVIGGGNIGGALADCLLARGCKNVIIADKEPEKVKIEDERIRVEQRSEDGSLPPADYYFSCVGLPRTIGPEAMRRMPKDAVIFNCASRRELDEDWLIGLLDRPTREALAWHVEPELLAEHRTLAVTFRGRDPRTIYIRRSGQPAFDGIRDKNPMMMDVVRAGLLALAVETLERMKAGAGHEIVPLSKELQELILDSIARHYGIDVTKAKKALEAA